MKKAPTVFIRSFAALVLGTGIVSAAAWAAQPQPPAETAQAQPTLKPVNKLCPIMENEVDAEAPTRQFRGVTIGFCCPGCDRKWDRKSDEAKMAMLTKMAPEAVAAINAVSNPALLGTPTIDALVSGNTINLKFALHTSPGNNILYAALVNTNTVPANKPSELAGVFW